MTTSMRILPAIIMIGLMGLGFLRDQKPPDDEQMQRRIADLVEKMGNEDPKIRDVATAELQEIGPKVIPALEKIKTDDLEVKRRLAGVLSVLKGEKEFRALRGHTSYVKDLAFSPKGDLLVSCGWDGLINFWDMKTSTAVHTIKMGENAQIDAVIFSPDGSRLAVARGGISIWDVGTRKKTATLEGHTGSVRQLLFTSDGKKLISCSYDTTIKVWDMDTFKEIRTFKGHRGWVQCVSLSPDEKWLASGGNYDDMTVRIWDMVSGKQTHILEGHTYGIFHVLFSPDGKFLISEGPPEWESHSINRSQLKIWDTSTWREIGSIPGDEAASMTFTPNGRILIKGTYGGEIIVWDLKEKRQLFAHRHADRALAGEHNPTIVTGLAFLPERAILASGGYDHTIRLWYAHWYEDKR